MKNPILVRLTKTESCLCVSTSEKCFDPLKKSQGYYCVLHGGFYFLKSEIEHVLQTKKSSVSNDIYNFAEISIHYESSQEEFLVIQFSWLKLSGCRNLSGETQKIIIPSKLLKEFLLDSDVQSTAFMSHKYKHRSKLVFGNSNNLKAVLKNSIIRRQFTKEITAFSNCWSPGNDYITIQDACSPYSFNFCCYYEGSRRVNGGIILHYTQDKRQKYYYSTHT